jgi:hypothetical protein
MNRNIKTTARAKFFTDYGVQKLAVIVQDHGAVLVWDSIASHYTSCHALSRAAQQRIVSKARALPPPHG